MKTALTRIALILGIITSGALCAVDIAHADPVFAPQVPGSHVISVTASTGDTYTVNSATAAAIDGRPILLAQADTGSAVPTLSDAGPASASTGSAAARQSDAVTNPAQHPAQAWSDEKAARKTSWPLAFWLAAVMLGKALAYGRDKLKGLPIVGKAAAWLAKGKGAMVVAAIVAVGAAGYDVVVNGGSWVAGLVAAGAALGGVLHSTTKGAETAQA